MALIMLFSILLVILPAVLVTTTAANASSTHTRKCKECTETKALHRLKKSLQLHQSPAADALGAPSPKQPASLPLTKASQGAYHCTAGFAKVFMPSAAAKSTRQRSKTASF